MGARSISSAIGVGLIVPFLACFSTPVHAANPWLGESVYGKRGAFRPATRQEQGAAGIATRANAPRISIGRAAAMPSAVLKSRRSQGPYVERAGARKAVPIARGQELGLRFRPADGDSPYGEANPLQGNNYPQSDADSDSRFRPIRKKRKRTYEELQADQSAARPAFANPAPYPIAPLPTPPIPGYGSYWNRW